MIPYVPPEVHGDVIDALTWLVRKRSYRGVSELLAEWDAGLEAIAAAPHLHSPADEASPGREVRYILTRRYGYKIVYEVTPTQIIIVAFVRASRRSSVWVNRLTSGDPP